MAVADLTDTYYSSQGFSDKARAATFLANKLVKIADLPPARSPDLAIIVLLLLVVVLEVVVLVVVVVVPVLVLVIDGVVVVVVVAVIIVVVGVLPVILGLEVVGIITPLLPLGTSPHTRRR